MTNIPKIAKPIAEYILKNVPRPKELPVRYIPKDGTGREMWFWDERDATGLALEGVALDDWPFNDDQIHAFDDWFHSQTDPQAAMNVIWGRLTELEKDDG